MFIIDLVTYKYLITGALLQLTIICKSTKSKLYFLLFYCIISSAPLVILGISIFGVYTGYIELKLNS